MTLDKLFLHTIQDLKNRSVPGVSEYDVIGTAVLLRKLLLDGKPLVHQVNRQRKLKFRFAVNVQDPIWKLAGSPPPIIWTDQDGFDPDTVMNPKVASLKMDEMLARVIIVSEGTEITVKDVIEHAAHVTGGVHAGQPSTMKEQILSRLAESLQLGGYEPGVRALQAVVRVVVKGLEPLTKLISSEL